MHGDEVCVVFLGGAGGREVIVVSFFEVGGGIWCSQVSIFGEGGEGIVVSFF